MATLAPPTDPTAFERFMTATNAEHDRLVVEHRAAREAVVGLEVDAALGRPRAPKEEARLRSELARLERALEDSEARRERAEDTRRALARESDAARFATLEAERRTMAREWRDQLRAERDVLADLLARNRAVADLEYRSGLLRDEQAALLARSAIGPRGVDGAISSGVLPFADEQLAALDAFLVDIDRRADQLGLLARKGSR